MKKIGTIYFMAVLFSAELSAQLPLIEKIEKKSYVYLLGGFNRADMSELNASLMKFGYPEFCQRFYSYGIGYHYKVGDRYILRLAGRKYLPQKNAEGGRTISVSAEWIYAESQFGYVFKKSENADFYLLFGAGINDVSLKIFDAEKTGFDSLLLFPERGIEFSAKIFSVSLSIGADLLIGPMKCVSEKSGIVLGGNFGYRFTPYCFSWETPSFNVEGGPSMDISGPFFEFCAGWGEL